MHKTFSRVLIANRGEIAVRVIRACRDLSIAPVAVYGPGEETSLHVRLADDAYRLEDTGKLPYLDIPGIVAIAQRAGCQAIHPGYGFLAENPGFAAACTEAGIVFVGPPEACIQAMGDKITARSIASAAGVPVVPGTTGPLESFEAAEAWSQHHGFPVAIKATAGGGGRGFRVAHGPGELREAFEGSAGEAARYFVNPVVYVERYLERPRHIEVQVFADNHGNCVWLSERDCSIQRRHQKLIEETPSPAVDDTLREALGVSAVRLAKAVNYLGAGTVEFMVTPDGNFYFLEMNTRIQVEHTITEEVTGIDLVKEQLRVAAGEELSFRQEDICPRGHALQCRINAEDAGSGFKPVPGKLSVMRLPSGPGVRVDTAMEPGSDILPAYDSLIAKLVTWGRDRDEAIARMRRALDEFHIEGVPTTISFHRNVVDHPAFVSGDVTTSFLQDFPETLPAAAGPSPVAEGAVEAADTYLVEVNGRRLNVCVHGNPAPARKPGQRQRQRPAVLPVSSANSGNNSGGNDITSPLQGTVLRVRVEPAAHVEPGDLICVVEAMKMENEITAPRAGEIASVEVVPGSTVSVGTVVARLA